MYRYPLGSVRPFFRHTTCFRILSLNSARQPLPALSGNCLLMRELISALLTRHLWRPLLADEERSGLPWRR